MSLRAMCEKNKQTPSDITDPPIISEEIELDVDIIIEWTT
jgi:hypothetical protein